MNKTKISAEIVADSLSPQGDRLTSLLVTMPRIILSEMNTHRMLSKNTSSSRAIPFKKMVESVQNDPFVPIAWQKHHSGMQGSEYLPVEAEFPIENITNIVERNWLLARDLAIQQATKLNELGVTKQLCNRLLEPFMWTTMLITGSKEGWDNFFKLRCPSYEWEYEEGVIKAKSKEEFLEMFIKRYPTNGERELHDMELVDEHLNPNDSIDWLKLNKGQAEIHMMALAESIYDAMNESTPRQLHSGQWHIPFEDKINIDGVQGIRFTLKDNSTKYVEAKWITEYKVKVSVGMAANTSYTVVDDGSIINLEKATRIHDKCKELNHSSVFEHCARVMSDDEYYSYVKGTVDAKIDADGFINIEGHTNLNVFGWCNNLKGFIPYRYMIDNKTNIE